jgi:hypothetical protein
MANLVDILKKGSTNRSITIRIIDSTDGTPKTAVAFGDVTLWYRRETDVKTTITPATQTVSGAWSTGGFVHISDGEYRLDVPNAAFVTGKNHVDIGGSVSGMIVISGRVRLVDCDPEDATKLGLTALPNTNANADAIGGLSISDVNSLDMDDILVDTNYIQQKIPVDTVSEFDPTTDPVEILATGGSASKNPDEIVNDIWNALSSDHVIADSFSNYVDVSLSSLETDIGTVQLDLNIITDAVEGERKEISLKVIMNNRIFGKSKKVK